MDTRLSLCTMHELKPWVFFAFKLNTICISRKVDIKKGNRVYITNNILRFVLHRDGLAVSVSASHAVGRGCAPRQGHTIINIVQNPPCFAHMY